MNELPMPKPIPRVEHIREPMKPSSFRLPQHCSPDRRRARLATLDLQRTRYQLTQDAPLDYEGERLWLPPHTARLPPGEDFSLTKAVNFKGHGLVALANAWLYRLFAPLGRLDSEPAYARLLRLFHAPPLVTRRWRQDEEFARQRLDGCNPLQLERYDSRHAMSDRLRKAAEQFLNSSAQSESLSQMEDEGRLFCTDYQELAHPLVQRAVARGLRLAAPLCLFYTNPKGQLRPLAIQLDAEEVYTPLDDRATWLWARSHAQAADGILHEGFHHLLATHLVSEVFALVTARQLHPDHPVHQLLAPHFLFNLAINDTARRDLLGPGGAIDTAIAGGVEGILALSRLKWSKWKFFEASPLADLERRGVADPEILADYWYRDDAILLWEAIHEYVRGILRVWYHSDKDVHDDTELTAWAAELASSRGGAIPGFPQKIDKRATLLNVLTEIIYRASAGHAAVNNGQFNKYGWVPNSPGSIRDLGTPESPLSEEALWQAMPDKTQALAQLSMVWVLSAPTTYSLVRVGDVPAFDPHLCPEAYHAVTFFRRRLQQISAHIRKRNEALLQAGKVPYTDMDPYNISRSIET